MQTLPAGIVDLVVTSPPYNLGHSFYSKFSDRARIAPVICIGVKTWGAEKIGAPPQSRRLIFFSMSVHLLPIRCFHTRSCWSWRDLFAFAEHNSLDQVDQASRRKMAGIVSRGHFKPISSRRFSENGLSTSTSFHFTKSGAPLKSIDSRSVLLIRTRAILRVGHTRSGAAIAPLSR